MDNKIITISILGVGARGGEAYGRYIHESKDRKSLACATQTNSVLKSMAKLLK